MTTPRIYVACLAAYNNGELHGRWIDVPSDKDELLGAIQAMLATSPEPSAEEWAIHDHEGFYDVRIKEYHDLDEVVALAELIDEHGELGAKVYADSVDMDEAKEKLADRYQGAYNALEDWAEQFLDETGMFHGVSDTLKSYFDYQRYARDAELGGDIDSVETSDGMVHVFWTH
jgi:antirestriction protein